MTKVTVIRRTSGRRSQQGSQGRQTNTKHRVPRMRYVGTAASALQQVSAPAAVTDIQRGLPFTSLPTSPGHIRIRHSEPFLTVSATTGSDFEAHISINPGTDYFPWLSEIASAFDRYGFKYLRFRWVPECSATTDGRIVISPDYDCADPNPSSMQAALTSMDSVGGALWAPLSTTISQCERYGKNGLLVRASAVAGDMHVYDLLKLHVYATNAGATAKGGQIWADYDVEFSMPDAEVDNTCIFACSTAAFPTLLEGTSPFKSSVPDGSGNTRVTVSAGTYRFISPTTIGSIVGGVVVDRLIGAAATLVHDYLVTPTGTGDMVLTLMQMASGFALTVIDKATALHEDL